MSSIIRPLLVTDHRTADELHVDELAHQICFAREQERQRFIAEAAYYRAERRGFAPGHDVEDWLAAESELEMLCNAL
jgi:hypothetical protein